MVAINSTYRQPARTSSNQRSLVDKFDDDALRSPISVDASRRRRANVEVFRDGGGEIIHVRIGRWRVLATASQRQIAEVRELSCGKVAVRMMRRAQRNSPPTSELWQLYDLQGRLQAALQCSLDGGFALATDYRSRQASRLVRGAGGNLETVETWNL